MNLIQKLPDVNELISRMSLSEDQKRNHEHAVCEVQEVLSGKSKRKLVIVGPCSADREDSVLAYMEKLACLAQEVKDRLLVLPRIYTGKPRTNGIGYKGLIHRPDSGNTNDDMVSGIVAMRSMHLRVATETGLFGVDEMLYPETMEYIRDILSYVAVGARSVENQGHRLVASGMEIPVGFKNPTSGDVNVLLNAIKCAQCAQNLPYCGWSASTKGNIYAHAIMRGFNDRHGRMHPNYHFEDMCDLYDAYIKADFKNMAVVVDCSHANSRKHYEEQPRIAKEVFALTSQNSQMMNFIKGLMIESYLEDGAQLIGGGVFGKSITDPCLGWSKTERLLKELCDAMD